MILADENIDHAIIKHIRNAGIEVFSIYESLRDASDEFKISANGFLRTISEM